MLLVSANKALRTEKLKENIYGEIKITKNPTKFKSSKINKTNKLKKLEEKITQIQSQGWRGKIYDDKVKPYLKEINKIKKDNDLSKEY
jgi:hypothetical protein